MSASIIKVVHIASQSFGGAGIAAFRVHLGLLNSMNGEIESHFVQKYPVSNVDEKLKVHRCTHFHSLQYRLINRLNLLPYFSQEDIFKRHVDKYPANYEIVSSPYSYFPIEEHPVVQEADIIHLHWVSGFLNYPSFFKKVQQPIVWTLHDMNPFQGIFHYENDEANNVVALGQLDQKIKKEKKRIVKEKENMTIVTPSGWMGNKSRISDIFSSYPHYLIPYGLDFDKFPVLNKIQSKEKFGVNNGLKTLFFIAQNITNRRKGFDILYKAIEELKGYEFNLLTLGENNVDIIDSNIRHIHIDSTDDIDVINTLYSAADATILPSREDNLPNVMLESFANGTPVISFANGGMAEHVRTGENGILVDEISAGSLRKAIEDLIKDKYSFDENVIRKYSLEHFDKEIQMKRYTELYKSILNK